MANGHVQPGRSLEFYNDTGADIKNGELFPYGGGVAAKALGDIPAGTTGVVTLHDVHRVPVPDGMTLERGQIVRVDGGRLSDSGDILGRFVGLDKGGWAKILIMPLTEEGGGGGGTTNYNALSNKPRINGVTLSGNQSAADLGISSYDDTALKNRVGAVETAVAAIDAQKLDALADIKTVGDGLNLDAAGTLTATGTGGDAKAFIATYNVTTAQEIRDYLDAAKEPFAPIVVKRGSDYYTAALATKSGDDAAILRVLGSGGGNYILFNYTVRGTAWSSSSYTFQKQLVSGTDIKTVGGASLLGAGDIPLPSGGATDWADITNKPENLVQDADYVHTDANYTAAEKAKLAGLSNYDDTALAARVATNETALGGHTVGKTVPADAVFTDTVYDDTALAGRVTANETALADRYTKAEADAKLAEAMTDVDNEHFHPVTTLPDPADADPTKRPKENHEYVLVEYEQDGTTIKSETHYLYYGGVYHQNPTGGISLDGYATEAYVLSQVTPKAEIEINESSNAMDIVGGGRYASFNVNTDGDMEMMLAEPGTYLKTATVPSKTNVDNAISSGVAEAKGYADNKTLAASGWGVARTGVATVTFNNSKWSSSATVDVSGLGFSSGADYDVVAQPTTGGTATPWGNAIAYVNADKGASSFSVSSVTMEESLSGTVNIKYTIFAKGYGAVAYTGEIPTGGAAGQVLTKRTAADGDYGWQNAKPSYIVDKPSGSSSQLGNVVQVGTFQDNSGTEYGIYEFYYRTTALPTADATIEYTLLPLLADYNIVDFVDATGVTSNGVFIGNGRTDGTNRLIVQQFSKNRKAVILRAYQDYSAQTALLKIKFIGTKNA